MKRVLASRQKADDDHNDAIDQYGDDDTGDDIHKNSDDEDNADDVCRRRCLGENTEVRGDKDNSCDIHEYSDFFMPWLHT